FFVVATGTAPLSYQWQKNGAAISTATAASYTTPATTSTDNGATFVVVVSNSKGSVTSAAATLTVNAAMVAPSIATQPTSQTVTSGQTATFAVVATGTAPLSYQWQKNGAAITGATGASYTTPATTTSDSGATFKAIATNSAGSATSAAAMLTVNAAMVAPSITTQPTSQTVTSGQTATFAVVATGTAPLSYQWQKNGTAISGATSSSYTTPATTSSDNGSTFQVVVSNSLGAATSNSATLTVNVASGPTVTVNWSDVHQTIAGFGAASGGESINCCLTAAQARLFFDPVNGVGLSLLRIRITPNNTFPEITTAQEAQSYGVRIWGTPWSPPASYLSCGSTQCYGTVLTADYQAYATYLSNYIKTLQTTYGLTNFFALSVQNEPNYNPGPGHDSAQYTGQQMHDFILNNLGPTLTAHNPGVQIIMPEEAQWVFDLATTTLNDPSAAAYVSTIAAHDYNYGAASPYALGQGLGKGLWETEVSTFENFDSSMTNALPWAKRINDWMTIASANAYHYWLLLGQPTGGLGDNEGLISSNGVTTAKRLYVFGNYSKFVRPGWVRIGATPTPLTGVSVSAYKDPSSGKFAIVAINQTGSNVAVSFALSGFTATSVTPWVTSSSLDLVQQQAISVGGSTFTATLPASSVTTFVSP
ncbi:MAG: hypothetical protein C5B58_01480, partial [Acidobacteria bacterium]